MPEGGIITEAYDLIEPLEPQEVLWFLRILRIDRTMSFAKCRKYLDLLFAEEQKQILRHRRNEDRVQSLFARLLVADTVSKQYRATLSKVAFAYGKYGKPFLENRKQFHFSISHSVNRVILANASCPIGTDIEQIRSYNPRVATRFFTTDEQAYLSAHDKHRDVFFRLWTCKEAYIKASGKGMNCPLSSFSTLSSEGTFYSFSTEGYFISTYIEPLIHGAPQLRWMNAAELIDGINKNY